MSEPRPRTQHWAPNPDPTSIAIPGVDATASVNDQIDQIDQLITIRLQNIDANFSRIQHLIAAKLLPAFKRYAEGTEPVREAAKFWKSFYEAAAQVRIPITSETSLYHSEEGDSIDQSVVNESTQESDTTATNDNPQEDSFIRGAPISSTPLIRDPTTVNLPKDDEDDDSWAASIESPFDRLGRQVKDLAQEDTSEIPEYPSTSSAPSFSPLHGSYTGALPGASSTHHQKSETRTGSVVQNSLSSRKGKSPLRRNVLRQNAALAAASDISSTPPRSLQTPRRNKTPKNPFLPPSSSSRKWNGLVDLRQPSPPKSRAPRTPGPSYSKADFTTDGYNSDSSDDLFPPGMSPPVTMQFAMATRARASPVKLMPTPARKAAERISRDLVAGAVDRGTGIAKRLQKPIKATRGDHSISSVAPSLPSLTRYSGRPLHSQAPSSFATNIEPAPVQEKFVTPAHQIYRSREGPQAFATEAGPDRPLSQEGRPQAAPEARLVEDEAVAPSPGSDSDSSEHDESNPSAGFLFATQNNARAQADDSFASSQQSMSSDEDEDDAARAARHPLAHIFAGGTQGVEDSFDQDESFAPAEEETVFGARQVGQGSGPRPRLTLMGDALIDDTDPRAVSLNPFAQVEQSPTPYVGEPEELG